jgi:LysR family transcriptional regulator of gallate degradation
MNVRDLLDVRVICEAGSLRKAATLLGVTQPTLSNRIAHLEDQLGAPLFDRSRGQSRPTDLALFIAGRAALIADEAGRLDREVTRYASGRGGLVRLGVGAYPARSLMAGIVGDICVRNPRLSFEIQTGHTNQLGEMLRRRDIDIAICAPIEPPDATMATEPLLESEIVIVARPDHPFCSTPPASIRELFHYPCALSFLEPRYREFLRRDYGIDFDAQAGRIVCSDFEMLVRIVVTGPRLFTAGPAFAFERELSAGQLKVVSMPVPFKHLIHMHTNRNAHPLPAVAQVQAIIQQQFAEIRAKLA